MDINDPYFQENAAEHVRALFIQGYTCGIGYAVFDKVMHHILRRLTYLAMLALGFAGRRALGVGSYQYEIPFLLYAVQRIVWASGGSFLSTAFVNISFSIAPELKSIYQARVADRASAVLGIFLLQAHSCTTILMLCVFHISFWFGLSLFVVLPALGYIFFINTEATMSMVRRIPYPIRRVLLSPIIAYDQTSMFLMFRMLPRLYRFLNRVEKGRISVANARVSQLPKYVFEPLHQPRLFRVLVVERRKLFNPPRCRLEVVSLDQGSAYMACSYVWGDPTLSRAICVDGCRLDITESAYNVISQQQSFYNERHIWIDAICINQTDLEEKSIQIGHMGNIFGHALWVDAYLKFGYADADLWRILGELQNKDTLNTAFGHTDWDLFYQAHLRPHWAAFVDLLKSPWFSRIWVMQEAMLASDLYLNYEQVRIGWPQLRTAIQAMDTPALQEALSSFESANQRSFAGNVLDRPLSLTYVRNFVKRDQSSLFEVLKWFRGFEATEPRDRVYAVLSLAPKTASYMLPVDYNIDVDVLLTRAMRWVIREKGLLCLLSCSSHSTELNDLQTLPSWVVDWGVPNPSLDVYDIPSWQAATRFPAIHDSSIETVLSDDNRLHVSMMSLADNVGENLLVPVLETQASIGEMNEVSRHRHDWLSKSRQIVFGHLDLETDADLLSLKDAFYRTLTYDHADPDDDDTLHWDQPSFRSDYKFLEEQLYVDGDFESSPIFRLQETIKRTFGGVPGFEHLTLTELLHKAILTPEVFRQNPNFENYAKSVNMADAIRINKIYGRLKFAVGRRIGLTSNGRIASFPPEARPGDEICLIAGAAAPFVVRKVDRSPSIDEPSTEYRQLVGWCYIYGGMDGSLATGPWNPAYLV